MSAAFTFDAYKLAEMQYKKAIDDKLSDKVSTDNLSAKAEKQNITITANTAISQENVNKYRIELIVSVSGPSQAKIVVFGFFTGNNFYNDNAQEQAELLPIGIALLLPIARSILASVSAQDGSKPLLLPTVNINEMLSHKEGLDNEEASD